MNGLKTLTLASMVSTLSACGGGGIGPVLTTGGASAQGHALAPGAAAGARNRTGSAGLLASSVVPAERGPSWMLPEAKSETLLYVSDLYNNLVDVYSYPNLKVVGQLKTDMLSPDGLCTDKKGDVFVVNNTPNDDDVLEFAHGGTTPIQTLSDPAQVAVSCSVDPVTGNLAVTNIENISEGPGSISIYTGATGYPMMYSAPNIGSYYYCGYDDKGNLYIDGFSGGISEGSFEFAEMPKGKATFNSIALKGATINFPGNIFYDGKYVDVADQDEARNGYIITSAIYRTTGSGGKVVSGDILQNSDDVTAYLVDGTSLLGTNFYGTTVGFWKYPKSKKETNTITGFSGPIGIALSK
jgi:hypothetical protein